MEELETFLRKTKNSKSPGSDDIPMEFYKWLDTIAKEDVLKIINKL